MEQDGTISVQHVSADRETKIKEVGTKQWDILRLRGTPMPLQNGTPLAKAIKFYLDRRVQVTSPRHLQYDCHLQPPRERPVK